MRVLVSSPSNVGEQAEVANLLHLYVTDTVKESALRAYTMGVPQDDPMPQSSSKRGREAAGDTEDTATYPGHSVAPTMGVPPPQQDPPESTTTETPIPTPLQLREEALIAFLAQPMHPEPDQRELDHISALLALLVEGE